MARIVSRRKRLTGYHEAEHHDILSYPEHPANPGHPASDGIKPPLAGYLPSLAAGESVGKSVYTLVSEDGTFA